MEDRQDKQYAMTTVLVKFITDNRPAIKASKVADKEAADVLAAYTTLTEAVGQAPLSTKAATKLAATARRALLLALPVIQGPLRSLATKGSDTELLARATLSRKQLKSMKPEELRDVSKALFAAADAQAPALADYALTPQLLAGLHATQQAFAGTVRSTSSLIDQRSTANKTADDLLLDLLQQVYELDKPMEVFSLVNKTLYDGYKKARYVGSTGGGKKKNGSAPAAGLTPAK